jgi:hypothetical protein
LTPMKTSARRENCYSRAWWISVQANTHKALLSQFSLAVYFFSAQRRQWF